MDTVPTEGDLANQMLNHSRPPEVEPVEGPVKPPFTSNVAASSAMGARNERQGMTSGFDSISSTELTLQTPNYPREPVQRLRRPVSDQITMRVSIHSCTYAQFKRSLIHNFITSSQVSRFQATALPVLSEHIADTTYDITDASVSAPSRSLLSFDVNQPVPRRLDSQDLIVGNQRPRPESATLRTSKRQLMTSPYRRQANSSTVKVSPSAAAKRDRYAHERVKARVQSMNLVAKFSNMSTGAQAITTSETSLTATTKGKSTAIEQDIDTIANDVPISTVKDATRLATPKPLTNTSTTDVPGKSTIRSPSRIPRAVSQQRRPGSSSSLVGRRSDLHYDKLKSLTAGQLLRRMNKSLLGTSRPPVLTRTIVQKAVSSSIHLALRKPATEGVSSTVAADFLTLARCTGSLSSPAVTPTSAITTESIADAVEDPATPPVATVTKIRTTTKPSVKSAVTIKSRRVTRSVLADRFRRVTRSTTAAASQML
ncbi:hypothetical protein BGZ96_010513 [Linnemannia gamsii]|uniref:Uncharacterized protein n=1 Tax=Linnemannia gamsii TaxID=64522 RepID=A0ABQ7JUU9_9FUNG|nr:hypothetical protein BGZ96_010513 [Linnemannia gamsii]